MLENLISNTSIITQKKNRQPNIIYFPIEKKIYGSNSMFNSFGSISNVIEPLQTQKTVSIILTIFINLHILTFSIIINSRTSRTCRKIITKH